MAKLKDWFTPDPKAITNNMYAAVGCVLLPFVGSGFWLLLITLDPFGWFGSMNPILAYFLYTLTAIGAIVVLYLLWILMYLVWRLLALRQRNNRRRWTPNIDSQFDIPSPNNLTLCLTSSEKKDVYVQCLRGSLKDTSGNDYLTIHQTELNPVENRPPNDELIFIGNLVPKTKQPIEIGIPHDDKIALRMDGRHLFGFRDGMYEYSINYRAQHGGHWFEFVCSAWLTIGNGALVKKSKAVLKVTPA